MACVNDPPTPPIDQFGRSSPPPSCAICLGSYKKKSFTENCLHQFCFNCLLKWSKIKAECPLCKQPFKNIIHNVRSNDSYDKYNIRQEPRNDLYEASDLEAYYAHRFQYRTTLTLNQRDNFAVHRLLYGVPQRNNLQSHSPIDLTLSEPLSRFGSRSYFRRSIYFQNLWVRPLPDFTGRFRECTANFYRNNPAQLNRLVPWLTRELSQCSHESNLVYVITRLTEMLKVHSITSRPVRDFLSNYLIVNVDHFIHEFHTFARTPYDMVGYDRHLEYQRGSPYDSYVNEISSSDSEDSTDSDIIVLANNNVEPGPSNNNEGPIELSYTPPDSPPRTADLICVTNPVIEFVSHSDTDDSENEVVMVKYIKPPHERTPEIVDLAASDSDDVIIDENIRNLVDPGLYKKIVESGITVKSTPSSDNQLNQPSTSGLGKQNLKRTISKTSILSDTDSDNDSNVLNHEKLKYFKAKLLKHKSTNCDVEDSSSNSSSNTSLAVQYSPPVQCLTPPAHKYGSRVNIFIEAMRSNNIFPDNNNINIPSANGRVSCDINDSTSCSSSNTSLAVQCSTPPSNFKNRTTEVTFDIDLRNIFGRVNNKDSNNSDRSTENSNVHPSGSSSLIRKKNKSSKKAKHKKTRRKSDDHHSNKKHKHKSKSKKKSKSREPSDEKSSKKKDSHNKSKARHNDANDKPQSSYWPRNLVDEDSSSTSDHNPDCRAKTLKSIVKTVPVPVRKSTDQKTVDNHEPLPSSSGDTPMRNNDYHDNLAGTSGYCSTDNNNTRQHNYGWDDSEDESS